MIYGDEECSNNNRRFYGFDKRPSSKNNTLGTETSFETASGLVYINVNELLRGVAKKLHLPRMINLSPFLN